MTTFYGQLDWFFREVRRLLSFNCIWEIYVMVNIWWFWIFGPCLQENGRGPSKPNWVTVISKSNFWIFIPQPPPLYIFYRIYGVMLHIHKPKQYVEHSRNEIKSRKIILLLYHNSQSLFQTYVDMRRHMPTENAALLYCGS